VGEVPHCAYTEEVFAAWLLMDRRLDWAALPVVMELLAVTDPEPLILSLVQMRDTLRPA
jgi:hypothetical protein